MANYRKRNDTWTYQIETKDENGQRKQISKGGFKTKKEAITAAQEIELSIKKGDYSEPKIITVEQFLHVWFDNYGKTNLKSYTLENRMYQSKRIYPFIGSVELDKLKPLQVVKMYQELLTSGLSDSYVNTIHRTLKNALSYAVKWQYIRVNPLDHVDAPRIAKKPVKTWTIDQSKQFLQVNHDDRYFIAYYLAIYTGMRQGEILNLKWSDVDIKKNVIYIRSGKTNNAVRVITLPDVLIDQLKRWKVRQNEYKLKLGTAYKDFDYVVATEVGTALLKRNLMRSFYNALKKTDVPKIRFHDLRHTHATILLTLGENPKIVSERLGHANIKITLDTYSHVLPDMQKETAIKLNKAFQ